MTGSIAESRKMECPAAKPGRRVVAFVTGGATMAGVEFNAIRLAERLDPERWRVILVCPEEGDLPAAFRSAGLEVRILPRPRLFSTSIAVGRKWRLPNPFACVWDVSVFVRAARGLAALLSEIEPDLVVTKGMFPHFYGGLAARRLGLPCLWHAEDFVSERWGGVFRRCFGFASRWLPTAIAVIGEPIAEQLPAAVRPRVRVIHNGADTARFRPGFDGSPLRRELGIPADALVVGNVARLTPWKGQHHLVSAFARIAGQVPRAHLLLVGAPLFDSDAFARGLQTQAAELGLATRIHFAGHRRNIPEALAAMDVLAYTSVEKDNCPLSLLEGMASGLPVVALDIPGVRLVLEHPEDGLLVPVERTDLLADALAALLNDSEHRCRLGACARRRIETAFSLELHVRQFEETFLKLFESSPLNRLSAQRI